MQSVLLVDDDPDIRAMAELSLSQLGGWRVFAAASGQQALATAENEQPDLVLLDLHMPGMDGLQTLAALKGSEKLSKIPVVFLTATADPDKWASYVAEGAAAVMRKPFDPMTLPDELRQIIEQL